MKEIKPWVEKIKAAYPEVEKLDKDALRAKTEELKKYIHESATAERAKVEELKASIETLELEDREEVFAQIDKTEKEILEKYEKALDEVLPVADVYKRQGSDWACSPVKVSTVMREVSSPFIISF